MSRVRAIANGSEMINNQVKSQKRRTMAKAAALGVAAGTVLYLAQKGKLNPKADGNKVIEAGKSLLRKPAIAVLNGVKTAGEVLNAKLNQAAKTNYWAGWIIEHGKVAKNRFSDLAYSISNVAESIWNKAKFAPNKAKAADLAAETFNNFIK